MNKIEKISNLKKIKSLKPSEDEAIRSGKNINKMGWR